ncbi:glucose-6-phosphate 1-epimerase [Duganella sp. CF458]|uniref:D-hexose-6-phosphate mutarotase n=1 Tax=Duganella sp. CF458 TaxID=1884368 RepID=UPI0008E8E8DF|nr:D-hexose-6-phosphate mutarotase [Duganella sp. CF458]SFF53318.1 glucose-6-phosphate 1-epimerase [Duganella sp. CF458]
MNEVRISTPEGAEATISLFGAHLMSWKTADGKERLFLSQRSALDGSAAVRGGVPVIFPQFATRGDGPRHGFARTATWRLVEQANDWAELALAQSDLQRNHFQSWPRAFELRLRFELKADALAVRYTVRNTGQQDFSWAGALHTYFAVAEFDQAKVDGMPFKGALDDIRPATPQLRLDTGAGTLQLEQQGFSEWVVWNPGAQGATATADMDDSDHRRFVCIEPARVDKQVLQAGAEWTGLHTISLIP